MIEIISGFIIAFAIAITGVGAGTITAPMMILYMDIEPSIAIGTALLFSFLVKIPVGISYMKQKLVNMKVLGQLLAGGIPGVIAGSILLGSAAKNPKLKALILCVVGFIVLLSAVINLIIMLRKVDISRHHGRMNKWIPVFACLIGLEVGFSSAGAGAMGTLLLLYTTNLEPREVIATDIIFGLALSSVGGGLHASMGHVDLHLLGFLIIGGFLGAWAGIVSSAKVPAKHLKLVLLVWLVFISAMLIYRGITGIL